MEKPVVGTRVGGVGEVVVDGVNGCLVPPENSGELARIGHLPETLEAVSLGDLARQAVDRNNFV